MSVRDAALTRALERAAPDLLAYLEHRVGPTDAPDLLGETMVVAWRRVRNLPQDPERARMWLFGIARGTLLNHARGVRRQWALVDRIRVHVPTDQVAPPSDDGIDVRDAIARLDPSLAELIRLVHWEQLSVADAAEVLRIPASTARGRYQRAKESLRAVLRVEVV